MNDDGKFRPISPQQKGEVCVAQNEDARRYQTEQYVDLLIPRPAILEQAHPTASGVQPGLATGIVHQVKIYQYVEHSQNNGNGPDEVSKHKGFDGGGDHPADALAFVEEHAAEVDRPSFVNQIRQLERCHQQYRHGQRNARKDKVQEALLGRRYLPVGTGFGRIVKAPRGGQGGIFQGERHARQGEEEPHGVNVVVVRSRRPEMCRTSTAEQIKHTEDGISGHQGRRWFWVRGVY